MNAADPTTVVHAYGLVPGDGPLSLPDRGIADSRVRTVAFHDLEIVVSDLPAESFGETAWAEHGEDTSWLTPVASAHHDVLQHLVEHGDVLPLQLPGIYPSDEALIAALESSRARLEHAWQLLAGRVEWSLQIFPTSAPAAPEKPAPRSGREYLEWRRSQQDVRNTERGRREVAVTQTHEALARGTAASVVRAPLDAAVTGRDEPMLLNSAYLVARDEEQRFLSLAEELHHHLVDTAAMRIEVTGPWPPYSFVGAEEPHDEDLSGVVS
ncbi:GvpL/GvpF family gas vesicle protein [Nocardioides sp. NBC_00850]|uniref:GvpL/GvpF family gas vesicle protein n=1 Tax=Nocardioides sp. NBC_00850 TaxID=2976001 RepID=UPI003863BE7F|nr:GvpL/GvpF family gas vesicle protein [Nocardioides sp. NBC_00850]